VLLIIFVPSIKNILKEVLAHSTDPVVDLEEHRKTILLNIIVLFGTVFLILLGIMAIAQQNTILAIADGVIFVFLIWMYFAIRRNRSIRPYDMVGTAFVGIFFVFLIANGGMNKSAFVWYFTYPAVSIFLLGSRKGGIASFSILAAAIVVFVLGRHVEFFQTYSFDLALRFVAAYIVLTVFTLSMENVRSYVQNKLEESNLELSRTNESLEKTKEELKNLSIRDGLTELYNRRHLDDVLPLIFKQGIRHNSMMSLIMIDIDHFKKYNDSYGHIAGDRVLVNVAKIFKSVIRRNTDLVFRYGGEEFLVLLTKTNRETAERITIEIMENLKEQNIEHSESENKMLTVSAGISMTGGDKEVTVTDFLAQADMALYRAKKEGRNCYRFY